MIEDRTPDIFKEILKQAALKRGALSTISTGLDDLPVIKIYIRRDVYNQLLAASLEPCTACYDFFKFATAGHKKIRGDDFFVVLAEPHEHPEFEVYGYLPSLQKVCINV